MSDHLFVSSTFQKKLEGVELVKPSTPTPLPPGADYSISQWAASNQDKITSVTAYPHPSQDPEYSSKYILNIVVPISLNSELSTPKRGDKIYLDICGINIVGEMTAGSAGQTGDNYEYNLIVTPV